MTVAPVRAPAPVLVVQHEDLAPLGRLATIEPLALEVVRPDRGEELPSSAAGLDGLLVLGGHMAAWEDDVAPWLPATRALLVDAVDRGTPTLAICLAAAWGVQYHPEVTADVFEIWMKNDADDLAARGSSPDEAVHGFTTAERELAAVAGSHAEAFAAIVTSSVVR